LRRLEPLRGQLRLDALGRWAGVALFFAVAVTSFLEPDRTAQLRQWLVGVVALGACLWHLVRRPAAPPPQKA